MHLLALADTVSTCDADFAERFAASVRTDAAQPTAQDVSPGHLYDTIFVVMVFIGYSKRKPSWPTRELKLRFFI